MVLRNSMTESEKTNTDIFVAIGILETKLDILSKSVAEIKDGTKADIEGLKVNKIGREEMSRLNLEQNTINVDIETRMRFIERYVWGAITGLGALVFALNYFHPFAN